MTQAPWGRYPAGACEEPGGRLSHQGQSRDNPTSCATGGMTATQPPGHVTIPRSDGCHMTIPDKAGPRAHCKRTLTRQERLLGGLMAPAAGGEL